MFRFDRLTAFGKFKCRFKYTLPRGGGGAERVHGQVRSEEGSKATGRKFRGRRNIPEYPGRSRTSGGAMTPFGYQLELEFPVIPARKLLRYFGGGAEWLGAGMGDPGREERGFRFDLVGFGLIWSNLVGPGLILV
jgi:hypothetical protein